MAGEDQIWKSLGLSARHGEGSGSIILAGICAALPQLAIRWLLQDDWRVSQAYMNLGLRYELVTVLTDRDNKLGTSTRPADWSRSAAARRQPPRRSQQFLTRGGLRLDMHGNGKTVIRGGGSVMYEQLPFSLFTAVATFTWAEPGFPWGLDCRERRHEPSATMGVPVKTYRAPQQSQHPHYNWQHQTREPV